jgi:NTP pyrophosphatase (non-canonical NTP hydrolase)
VKNTSIQSDFLLLRQQLRDFAADRDWDQFHTPKNLATALNVESGELLEPFHCLSTGSAAELGENKLAEARLEMADVLAYLIMLADKLDVNLVEALQEKIKINSQKYPIERVHGSAKKYTDYND